MVDLQDYTRGVAGDTVKHTWQQFVDRYGDGMTAGAETEAETVRLAAPPETAVIEGNTYIYLQTADAIYRLPADGNEEALFAADGDRLELSVIGEIRDGLYSAELKR